MPRLTNPELVDAYETALGYELSDIMAGMDGEKQPSIHVIIEFLQRNLYFARYGFFSGFGSLLHDFITTDARAQSEAWLISVLLKLASLGVSDPVYLQKAQALTDHHAERFSIHSLVKFVILTSAQGTAKSKHRDLILKRLRYFNPENLTETRLATQLLICLPQIEGAGELFGKYLEAIMILNPQFDFQDIVRMLRALAMGSGAEARHYQIVVERLKQIFAEFKGPSDQLNFLEQILQYYKDLPTNSMKEDIETLLLQTLDHLEASLNADAQKQTTEEMTRQQFNHIYPKYLKHLIRILDVTEKLVGPISPSKKGQQVSKIMDV